MNAALLLNKQAWKRFGLYLGTLALAASLAAGALGQAGPTGFDAISIKASKPTGPQVRIGLRSDPQRLTIQGMPLNMLIARAFNLKDYQLKAPAWMSRESFDIDAETANPASQRQMLAMLQPYLVKQFELKTHRETKMEAVDALQVASGGLKLKSSAAGAPGGARLMMRGGSMRFTGSLSMSRFAELLANLLNRPVLDETHQAGSYEFDFSFSGGTPGAFFGPKGGMRGPSGSAASAARPPARSGAAPAQPSTQLAPAPPLQTALPQELGLRLMSTKEPIEILTIDSANRTPVGN